MVGVCCLSSCEYSLHELHRWAQQEAGSSRSKPFELPALLVVEPPPFIDQGSITDPFAIARLNGFSVTLDEQLSQVLFDAPQNGRYLSPLKNLMLQKIQLIATIVYRAERTALIQYKDTIYFVKVGMMIGKNGGTVTDIRGDAIQIREIIDNGSGKLVPRVMTISTTLLKK